MDELIAKLEALTESDRQIDWALAQALDVALAVRVTESYEGDKADCIAAGLWPARQRACWREAMFAVPRYTASLDAAVKLVEEKLPDWTAWELKTRAAKALFQAELSRLRDDNEDLVTAYAKTPAIALCLALLRALDKGSDKP